MILLIGALAFNPHVLIETARADYNSLQNFICHEKIVRSHNFKTDDVIDATVLLSNRGEVYSDIVKNGTKHFPNIRMVGGFWSQGEYGSLLNAAISALTSKDWVSSRVFQDGTVELEYFITREQSEWTIVEDGHNERVVSYSLTIVFSPDLRIKSVELESHDVKPSECGYYMSVTTALQRVAGNLYLLPLDANTARTSKNGKSHENLINFTDYRQFHIESTLITDDFKIVPTGDDALEDGGYQPRYEHR